MPYLLPLSVPAELVDERGVVPRNDFVQRHTRALVTPGGDLLVATDLFYNYTRYDSADRRSLRAWVLTRFDTTLAFAGQQVLESLTHTLTHVPERGREAYSFNDTVRFGLTGTGERVFGTEKNRTYVVDDAGAVVRAWDVLRPGEGADDSPGISEAIATPDGGFVALRGHGELLRAAPGTHLSDGLGGLRPLTDVATVGAAAEAGWYRGYVGEVAALDERICIPFLCRSSRSGYVEASSFRYALVDARGRWVGNLPLGAADSPYEPRKAPHPEVVAHPTLPGWVTRSQAAFHLFDPDGEPLARVPVSEDPRLKEVRKLHVLGVGPRGELLLVHRAHDTLVVTAPVTGPEALEPALVEVASGYRKAWGRLKKRVRWDGRFVGFGDGAPEPIVASKTPKKRAPVVEPTPPAAPTEPAESPEQAVVRRPSDPAARQLLADALLEQGDPLGERIAVAIQLQHAQGESRRVLQARADSLDMDHMDAWRAAWNTPHPVIRDRWLGLPSTVTLERPVDVGTLGPQLDPLPIRELNVERHGVRDLKKLAELPSWPRLERLRISADSKKKLGKSAATWLAANAPAGLRRLTLYRVELPGAQAAALVGGRPELRELWLRRCLTSDDALVALSAAGGGVQTVRELSLAWTPLSEVGIGSLAAWTALRTLVLRDCGLSDSWAGLDLQLPIHTVDLYDNARLGRNGLAWWLGSCPDLTGLAVPRQIGTTDLMPVLEALERLRSLDVHGADREVQQAVLEALPGAHALEELVLGHEGLAGSMAYVRSAPSLRRLSCIFGGLGDDDLAVLAEAHGVQEMKLGDGFGDAGVRSLCAGANALRRLHLQSGAVTEVGMAAALARPELEHLELWGARLDRADPVLAVEPGATVRLYRCSFGSGVQRALREHLGARLRVD